MRPGDLVRFKPPFGYGMFTSDGSMPGWETKFIGLLVKYEPWEKIAEVMYGGQVLRIAARDVEKAGKKDVSG
jgi:hypothetical protein